MKLILLFRDPVERAFSHWRMRWRSTAEGLLNGDPPEEMTFDQAVRQRQLQPQTQSEVPSLNRFSSYVDRGLYGLQTQHLLTVFPREQLLLSDFDLLVHRPRDVLRQVADFLCVDAERFPVDVVIHENAAAPGGYPSALDEIDVSALHELFRSDLEVFQQLSGLDISHWPTLRAGSPHSS
ncbi:MAG: sulfotransferase domain-containing protein [Frankiaceae bacterium]|nr:sulfotransferase domain-containing protein [Frankiaceae bacterium]